ncbi:DUF2958 domain-containing protein [Arthrobacter sp. IK3]|uniref:DUF2958 domain-containing protein n=1 Tax=Arthrobacter sp. IK3 TaxID=3448169 RepID=UPI003EE1A1B9
MAYPTFPELHRDRRGYPFYGPELSAAPDLYATEEVPTEEKLVYARYFLGESVWMIFETDKQTGEGFGFVVLNGDTEMAEMGYIDIMSLEGVSTPGGVVIDRDLEWQPKPFGEVDPRAR